MAMMLWFLKDNMFFGNLDFLAAQESDLPHSKQWSHELPKVLPHLIVPERLRGILQGPPAGRHCSKNCRFVIPDLSQGTSLVRLLPKNHRKWIQYQKVLYNSNAQADCTADVWSHLISSHHISMVCFSPDVLLSQPQRIGSIIRSNPATNARTRA